jgi:hypothetical protein
MTQKVHFLYVLFTFQKMAQMWHENGVVLYGKLGHLPWFWKPWVFCSKIWLISLEKCRILVANMKRFEIEPVQTAPNGRKGWGLLTYSRTPNSICMWIWNLIFSTFDLKTKFVICFVECNPTSSQNFSFFYKGFVLSKRLDLKCFISFDLTGLFNKNLTVNLTVNVTVRI